MPQARLCSLLAPLALLALTTPIAAQGTTACLQGRVFGSTGSPLAGARVSLPGLNLTETTDHAGRFAFDKLPADTLTVRVVALGYKSSIVAGLLLSSDGIITQDFALEPARVTINSAATTAPPTAKSDATPQAARPPVGLSRCPTAVPASNQSDRLPVDQISRVLTIAPGTRTLGPPGTENTYVDGVPVQRRTPVADSTTGRVEGVIRREDGAPLAAARVAIVGTPLRTITDSLGRFRLQSIPPGLVTIRVTRPEFRDAVVEGLRIRGGQLILQDVVLARAP